MKETGGSAFEVGYCQGKKEAGLSLLIGLSRCGRGRGGADPGSRLGSIVCRCIMESPMARVLRLEGEGAVYHVIVRGNERKAVFRDDEDRRAYLDRLAKYRERFGFRLLAFCLMGNHIHLAIERGPTRLSRVMLALQSSYAQRFNRRHNRVGHLFQGRYKAFLIEKDRYLLALIRYEMLWGQVDIIY